MSNDFKSTGFPQQPYHMANACGSECKPLDTLADALAKAGQEFDRGRREPEGDGGRRGVAMALIAATDCLASMRPDINAMLLPLKLLGASIGDLSNGKVGPMLTPARRSGRPPASIEQELLREVVACAVLILMDDGKRERDAEKFVARKLKTLGVSISSATVGNWVSAVRACIPRGCGRPGKPDENSFGHSPMKGSGALFMRLWGTWRAYRGWCPQASSQPYVKHLLSYGAHEFGDLRRLSPEQLDQPVRRQTETHSKVR